jgi:hypothetical protein
LSSSLLYKNLKIKYITYEYIISSFVLYECETWPVILREAYRLRMFENKVLRRINGPEREKEAEG